MKKIYDRVLYIVAVKKTRNAFSGETFQHEFTSPARIYGLEDGSLLIKGDKPLWDMFRYSRKGNYVNRVKRFYKTGR